MKLSVIVPCYNEGESLNEFYDAVSKRLELEKITHEHPMLSLPKTKSIEEVSNFIGDIPYIIMSKMDGLTCSLTYENGELVRAETRGKWPSDHG